MSSLRWLGAHYAAHAGLGLWKITSCLRLRSTSIIGVRHHSLFLILNELNKKLLLDSFERLSVCSSSEWICGKESKDIRAGDSRFTEEGLALVCTYLASVIRKLLN